MTKKTKVTYLRGALNREDLPEGNRPEVALIGRSNSGKSTLLNSFVGEKIARVSGTPGHTKIMNFYDMGEYYRLVDLPGYGYASRGHEQRDVWSKAIFDYLQTRPNLVGMVLICDIRRELEEEEEWVVKLSHSRKVGLLIALNKVDKLGRAELNKNVKRWEDNPKSRLEKIFPISALRGNGTDDLEDYLFHNWIKPAITNP